MQTVLSKISSDFKASKVSIKKLEEKIGLSNGLIGKATKGKYIMNQNKYEKLIAYHAKEFPSEVAAVQSIIESEKPPVYVEGGLYRFENGGFVEFYPKIVKLPLPNGARLDLSEHEDYFKQSTLPSNKEDEKGLQISEPHMKILMEASMEAVKRSPHLFKDEEPIESEKIPLKKKGESGIDFSIRLAEWKEKNK